jgi:hypothetical protein
MRVSFFFIILTTVTLGCSHRDPIDRAMDELTHENVPSYAFQPIDLPKTATPEQLITVLSKNKEEEQRLHFDFTSFKILQIRSVQAPPPFQKITAVLLDTSLGREVVLLQPIENGANYMGWEYRIYDAD